MKKVLGVEGGAFVLIVVVIGGLRWMPVARLVRAQILSLREKEFVDAARSIGAPTNRILFKELLPNLLPIILVYATLIIPTNILAEAALSFLGVGVPPPQPAWGLMLADGKKGLMVGYWWLTVLPGVCIMLMVLSSNLLGDWLRVKLDPQLRQI
ncbi:MAG: ABC transporter permease [Proteobacteria bacterium]|nr:ABC transporter permease [Pseudomonadota bacterium]